MADLNINFNISSKNVDLSNLTTNSSTDLNRSMNLEFNSSNSEVTNKFGGTSTSQMETLDLSIKEPSNKIESSNTETVSFEAKELASNSTFNVQQGNQAKTSDRSLNVNLNDKNSSTMTSNRQVELNNTKSINNNSNNQTAINNNQSKQDINIPNTSSTSTTSSMSQTSSTFTSSINNQNTPNASANTLNMKDNIASRDNKDFNQTIDSKQVITLQTKDNNGNIITEEISLDEYRNTLKKSGLTDKDITRIINGEITPTDLFSEIEKDPVRLKQVMIPSYLESLGLDYNNLEELKKATESDKQDLKNLLDQRTKTDNRELDNFYMITARVQMGENFDSVLSTQIVAWMYKDELGNTCYRYDDPYINYVDNEIEYTALTFNEMYPDSKYVEEFRSVLTKYTRKRWFKDEYVTTYIWDGTEEAYAFLDELAKEYGDLTVSRKQALEQLDKQIEAKTEEIQKYEYYYEYINQEIDYYIENINQYTVKEDFYKNCKFDSSNSYILTKIIDSFEGYDYSMGSIPIKSLSDIDEIAAVLSMMVNQDENIYNCFVVDPKTGLNIMLTSTDKDNLVEHFGKWQEFMTEQEREVFNYILNTEGSQKAYDYIFNISHELDNRWLANKTKEDAEYAKEHPVLASIASVVITPFEGISAACYSTAAYFKDSEIYRADVYSVGDVYRGAVAESIESDVGRFVYNTGMSMADTAVLIGIGALTGGAGMPAISAVTMGSRAYVSCLNDCLDRGLTNGQAVALAWTSAVVETAMESYSAGHLLNLEGNLSKGTTSLIKATASKIENPVLSNIATKTLYVAASSISQGLAEGEEEFSTEVLNYICDELIAGDLSNHTTTINSYIDLGYSEEEARKIANKQFESQLGQAFLGGFASGVCFGAIGSLKTNHSVSTNIANEIESEYKGDKVAYLKDKNMQEAEIYAQSYETLRQMQVERENLEKLERKSNLIELERKVKQLYSNQINSDASLTKSILGTLTSPITAFTKLSSASVEQNQMLLNKITNEGLYHITSLENAQNIMNEGTVNASKPGVTSYGKAKSFFFAGTPNLGEVCLNLDTYQEKLVAVKIKESNDTIIKENFKYRVDDDFTIMHDGNFNFNKENAQIVYLGLTVNEQGEFTYKEISKEDYQTYSLNKSQITNEVIKKQVNLLKGMYYGLSYQFNVLTKRVSKLQELKLDTSSIDTSFKPNIETSFSELSTDAYLLTERLGKTVPEYLMEYIKEYDALGNVSKETGLKLENLFFDDDYVIGIHRCGMANATDIIKTGLNLTGHLSSGVVSENINLNENISFFTKKSPFDFALMLAQMKTAGNYKSTGIADCLLIKIPKSEVSIDADGDVILNKNSSIIKHNSQYITLDPSYISGYVNINNQNIGEFIENNTNIEKSSSINNDLKGIFRKQQDNSEYTVMRNVYQVLEKMQISQDKASNIISSNLSKAFPLDSHILSFFKTDNTYGTSFSYVDTAKQGIFKGQISDTNEVTSHEFGHLLFDVIDSSVSEDYIQIRENIVNKLSSNEQYVSFLNEATSYLKSLKEESFKEARNYESTHSEVIKEEVSSIVKSWNEIENLCKSLNLAQDGILKMKAYFEEGNTPKLEANVTKLLSIKRADDTFQTNRRVDRQAMQIDMITGVIDSIFDGKNPYYELYKKGDLRLHKMEYFQKRENIGFNEQFADYTAMRIYGEEYAVAKTFLENTIGKEWFNMMNNKYETIASKLITMDTSVLNEATSSKITSTETNQDNLNNTVSLSEKLLEADNKEVDKILKDLNFENMTEEEQLSLISERLILTDYLQNILVKNKKYIESIETRTDYRLIKALSRFNSENVEYILSHSTILERMKSKSKTDKMYFLKELDELVNSNEIVNVIKKIDLVSPLLSSWDIEEILKLADDSDFAFELFSNDEIYKKILENGHIYEDIKYLDSGKQLELIQNKIINNNMTVYDFNIMLSNVKIDTYEALMKSNPNLKQYVNVYPYLVYYKETSNQEYLEYANNIIESDNIESIDNFRVHLLNDNLLEYLDDSKLEKLYRNASLDEILSAKESTKNNSVFNKLINEKIKNLGEKINIETLMKISDFLSESEMTEQLNKMHYVSDRVLDSIDGKFTQEQINIILSKIDKKYLLQNLNNNLVLSYLKENLSINNGFLTDINRKCNLNGVAKERILEIYDLVDNQTKLLLATKEMLEDSNIKNDVANILNTNPELINKIYIDNLQYIVPYIENNQKVSNCLDIESISALYLQKIYNKETYMNLLENKLNESISFNTLEAFGSLTSEEKSIVINQCSSISSMNAEMLLKSIDNSILGTFMQKINVDSVDGAYYLLSKFNHESIDVFIKNCNDKALIVSANTGIGTFRNEVMKRFLLKNDRIFNIDYAEELIELNFDDNTRNLISESVNSKLENLLSSSNYQKYQEIMTNAKATERLKFLYAIQDGLLTDEKIDTILNLKKKNRYLLQTLNYKLFDDSIYSIGEKFVDKLSKYSDIVDKLVLLKENENKYNLFTKLIVNDETNNQQVSDYKMFKLLDYLFDNSVEDNLFMATDENANIVRNILLKRTENFYTSDSPLIKTAVLRSLIELNDTSLENYEEKYNNLCDSLMNNARDVAEAKNIFFNKYFSLTIEDVQQILRIYGKGFEEVAYRDESKIATIYLESLKNISDISSLEDIKDMYDSFRLSYTMDETLLMIDEIKQAYTKNIKESLYNPTNIIDYVEFNNSKIPLYGLPSDFKMLVQSTQAYSQGMKLINNNYKDAWNLSERTKNHGICCSLISNDNLGIAPITGEGILIGFNNFHDQQINMMAPYDIYTENDGYAITASRPYQFLSADSIVNNTRHTHNEFNLERRNLTGEGEYVNIQPSYVIVIEDMEQSLKENAYKASLDFNIPLVYLNKETIAKNESAKITSLINRFNTTGDLNILKTILTEHENNRSGLRVTAPDIVDTYFKTDNINNLLENTISRCTSKEQLLFIQEFLEDENNKFDATNEAVGRINKIDIDIDGLLSKINNIIKDM